jgi:hypothetical protein
MQLRGASSENLKLSDSIISFNLRWTRNRNIVYIAVYPGEWVRKGGMAFKRET